MDKLKNSNIVKTLCYFLVPMLVLIIILNAFSIIYYAENESDFLNYNGYVESERFVDQYLANIQRAIQIAENEKEYIKKNSKTKTEAVMYEDNTLTLTQLEKDGEAPEIQYNFYSIRNYDVLLISPDGDIITNVEKTINTDTREKIEKYILSKKYYWKYDKQEVETNIENMSYEKHYYDGIAYIIDSGYEVYTAIKDENNNEFYAFNMVYEFVSKTYETAPSIIIVSSILLIIICAYIIISIGHKDGVEGIYTNSLDDIPYEIVGLVSICLLTAEIFALGTFLSIINNITTKMMINTSIIGSICMGIIIYITLAITGVTTIRRIKAHTFWENTIVYKIMKFVLNGLFTDLSRTAKLVIQYGGFIWISIILILIIREAPIFILLLLAFWYYVFKKILNYNLQLDKIREQIKNMYNGNKGEKLDEEKFTKELKQVAIELNDISGGLTNAIDEAMKSERLKTELITNVSHDIKTPLTSIINYVDLMKQEEIENEKVKEYLEVLDNKSQRLKKLTEDLVEASKASSGNIKLTMEKLNVKELIKQVSGEFEDKFEKRGLEIIEDLPEEEVFIEADSRYMYRVMENMYVNISKYALENSRVYIDIEKKGNTARISLKNISQDQLNISVDELMQRFVRGDSSRTTEGSGLGISIAKSLTELQKGKFNIYLDGDLFKVVIEFTSKD